MKTYSPRIITAIFLLLVSITGYQNAVADNTERYQAYENKLNAVVKDIQNNPDYKRIPLDSKSDQDWFNKQAFKLWNKEDSKDQFVNEGISRFPGYRKSFEFLADRFLN